MNINEPNLIDTDVNPHNIFIKSIDIKNTPSDNINNINNINNNETLINKENTLKLLKNIVDLLNNIFKHIFLFLYNCTYEKNFTTLTVILLIVFLACRYLYINCKRRYSL